MALSPDRARALEKVLLADRVNDWQTSNTAFLGLFPCPVSERQEIVQRILDDDSVLAGLNAYQLDARRCTLHNLVVIDAVTNAAQARALVRAALNAGTTTYPCATAALELAQRALTERWYSAPLTDIEEWWNLDVRYPSLLRVALARASVSPGRDPDWHREWFRVVAPERFLLGHARSSDAQHFAALAAPHAGDRPLALALMQDWTGPWELFVTAVTELSQPVRRR